MTCYQRRDELPCDNHECLCPIARAAYQRGREDAAKAVTSYYDTDHNGLADGCMCGFCEAQRGAIAAARGGGEPSGT